ncbi:unnamed protein product, partial [Ixodes pacificus]
MSELGQVEQRLLLVLVEFDSLDWKRREWIRVYEDRFSVFLVEETLAWHVRNSGDSAVPALVSPLCLVRPLRGVAPICTLACANNS